MMEMEIVHLILLRDGKGVMPLPSRKRITIDPQWCAG